MMPKIFKGLATEIQPGFPVSGAKKVCSLCQDVLPPTCFTKTQYRTNTKRRKCKKCSSLKVNTVTPVQPARLNNAQGEVDDETKLVSQEKDQNSTLHVPAFFIDRTKISVPSVSSPITDKTIALEPGPNQLCNAYASIPQRCPVRMKPTGKEQEKDLHSFPSNTNISGMMKARTRTPVVTASTTSSDENRGIGWETLLANYPKAAANMLPLQQRLGYRFKNARLLYQALTTPMALASFRDSMQNGVKQVQMQQHLEDNVRLQIVGSSVYRLAVSQYCYEQQHCDVVGSKELERRIFFYENISSLMLMANANELEKSLLCTIKELTSPSLRSQTLPFALLAVYGGIFLDAGFPTAAKVISRDFAVVREDQQAEAQVGEGKALQYSPISVGSNIAHREGSHGPSPLCGVRPPGSKRKLEAAAPPVSTSSGNGSGSSAMNDRIRNDDSPGLVYDHMRKKPKAAAAAREGSPQPLEHPNAKEMPEAFGPPSVFSHNLGTNPNANINTNTNTDVNTSTNTNTNASVNNITSINSNTNISTFTTTNTSINSNSNSNMNRNPASNLNELAQRCGLKLEFVLLEESGPAHSKNFSFSAVINGEDFGVGVAGTKKKAKSLAATQALSRLQNEMNQRAAQDRIRDKIQRQILSSSSTPSSSSQQLR